MMGYYRNLEPLKRLQQASPYPEKILGLKAIGTIGTAGTIGNREY